MIHYIKLKKMLWSQFFLSSAFIINISVIVTAAVSTVAILCKFRKYRLPFEGIATNFILVYLAICVLRLVFLILDKSFPDNNLVQRLILLYLINATQILILMSNIIFVYKGKSVQNKVISDSDVMYEQMVRNDQGNTKC